LIKEILKLFWRAGVKEIKPPMRQIMTEDEFSKKTLIGEDEEYQDMSKMVDDFGKAQKQEDIDSIYNTLKNNNK
tara:strand:- start:31 stop:252 length:222 start_codon:yes stop_codon:yes gene_type:complete